MRALGRELPERDRLVDVLQALPTGVAGAECKVLLDALVERLAHADAAGRGFGLQMSGDVYAVAIDGAVGFLDDVAQMHADAHPHAPLFASRAAPASAARRQPSFRGPSAPRAPPAPPPWRYRRVRAPSRPPCRPRGPRALRSHGERARAPLPAPRR